MKLTGTKTGIAMIRRYWRVILIVAVNKAIWRYLGDEWTPVLLIFGLAGLVMQHLFDADWLSLNLDFQGETEQQPKP